MRKIALFVIFAGICLLVAACQAAEIAQPTSTPQPTAAPSATPLPPTATAAPPTDTAIPPTPTASAPVLEIIAQDGSSKYLTLDEIKALPSSTGQAGIKSSTGQIFAPTAYLGVSLKDLASLAGELDASMGINVFASDGYGMTFS